ncbi:PREDICTED: protein max isoform X1 [Myotis brandtii]|uniref:protein max isoform X1 n=1 Tax=Myotis brandtii TaxID=109478 RepID=UPI00070475EB|nr:PREDICTED: protein max isoform X1 [Myotis brandtii]
MQFLMGFVVFLALARPSVRGTGTTSLGGPSVTSPVTCRRADRACVPPLIRCCSEEADKRAHHNALERKRRDHIKDSFHSLRDSVPSLQGEKQQASRAQILDKATEYIQYMRRKNHTHQQDIDDLKRQNALLEQQVRALEKARSSAQLQTNYPSSDNSLYTNAKGSAISAFDGGSDSSSESEPEEPQSRKKLRMEAS